MKTVKKAGLILVGLILTVVVVGLGVLFLFFPKVDPAPDLKVQITPEKVARGKYIANSVAVCMDCHSQRDWSSFSGPLVSGTLGMGGEHFSREMGFPGIFYSKNITPAGIGTWTDGEIYRAITSGVNKDGKSLFPVMPYHHYNQLHDQDIHAVIAYLRSLAPIENEIPDRTIDFPVNLILRTMPAPRAEIPAIPEKSDKLAYGKYLATMASCVDCHTPVKNGNIIKDQVFSGGREFVMPGGILTAPNLTPSASGLKHWTEEQFVSTFKQYQDSSYVSPKLGPEDMNTLMPWIMYAGMEEEDLKAIFTYLQSLPPIERTVQKFAPKRN